jgi:hypothetical protein
VASTVTLVLALSVIVVKAVTTDWLREEVEAVEMLRQ